MTDSARPINVLHTVRSLRVDGVVKVILRNMAHRDRARFRHHVCAMLPDGAIEGELADELRALGIQPIFAGYRGPASVTATIAHVRRTIARLGIDVVHANRTIDLALAGTAARMSRVPVVSSLHWLGRVGDHPEDADGPWLRRRAEMMAPVLLNRAIATRIVAVSRAVASSFGALPGFPSARVEVVYPGMSMDRVPMPDAARGALRRSLSLGDGPVILNVGRLEAVKGQRHLVPMMRDVLARVPTAVLIIAGEGELRQALTRAIADAALEDSIRLLGTRADVNALLEISDVLVLASESEAAPLPLFEAMRAATPVVATAVGGVREIVADGVTGFVVPRGDPPALAAAVVRLLDQPATAARMGDAGRRVAFERFDVAASMRTLERIYAELAARRSERHERTAQTVSQ